MSKSNTQTQTKVHDPSHTDITGSTVPVGTAVHDAAFVGTEVDSKVIGGTVTYNFFSNGTCANATTSGETVTMSGGTVPESTPQTPGPGSYSYQAVYSGDANYNGSIGVCEPFNISQNHPTIATTLSSSTVNVGTPVHDSATLTGATAGAGGTVTYSVFAGTSCSGTAVGSSTVTVASGTVPSSSDFTPLSAGTYNWQAVYSGDAQNTSTTSACQTETLTAN